MPRRASEGIGMKKRKGKRENKADRIQMGSSRQKKGKSSPSKWN